MTWRERLAKAKKRGRLDDEDRTLLRSFDTCLVGEQRQLHPEVIVYTRDIGASEDWPIDAELRRLGGQAYNRTGPGDVDLVEQYLEAIEDRVLQLKREAGA